MDMCLPKFDIYQGKISDFFQEKNVLFDARSDIRLVQRKIVSTGQFIYSGLCIGLKPI